MNQRIILLLVIVCGFESSTLLAQRNTGIGLNQVQVLRPGESDTLVPGIDLSPINDMLKVDFPPTVHVHRMYYSRSETIQGPIVQGGRHIVVARNPVTNETSYVDTMLPAGSPRIRYEPKRIVYVYDNQHVVIGFKKHCFRGANAKVTFAKGPGIIAATTDFKNELSERIKFNSSRSRFLNTARENGLETRQVLVGATEALGRFGEELNDSIRAGLQNLPGVSSLKSLADDRLADREKSAAALSGLKSRIDGTNFRFNTNR